MAYSQSLLGLTVSHYRILEKLGGGGMGVQTWGPRSLCFEPPQHLHDRDAPYRMSDEWHQYFRDKQPRTLIVWGQNDPFFSVEGAKAFLTGLPNAELHLLDAGHFALEEKDVFIADRIREFLGRPAGKAGSK